MVRGGLVGCAPARKSKVHDPTGRDEVRYHAIVQVQVVKRPVDQRDRVALTRIVSDVDPGAVDQSRPLLEGHVLSSIGPQLFIGRQPSHLLGVPTTLES